MAANQADNGYPRNGTDPLATIPGAAVGQPRNGDYNRDAWADTSREGNPSTRRTLRNSSVPSDFRSCSVGEECGYGETTVYDADGNSYTMKNARDPWGIQRPVGGTPDPNVGLPR